MHSPSFKNIADNIEKTLTLIAVLLRHFQILEILNRKRLKNISIKT